MSDDAKVVILGPDGQPARPPALVVAAATLGVSRVAAAAVAAASAAASAPAPHGIAPPPERPRNPRTVFVPIETPLKNVDPNAPDGHTAFVTAQDRRPYVRDAAGTIRRMVAKEKGKAARKREKRERRLAKSLPR
jgi:hypothetical protein